MAGNKCFDNFALNNSSSDYVNRLRQTTIYHNWACKSYTTGDTNPVKKNGYQYNDNFGITKITNVQEGCLKFAKNYQLLLDITKGSVFVNDAVNNSFDSYQDSLSGNFYSIDYSNNGVNVVVDTSYNAGNANKIIFPMTQSQTTAQTNWTGLYPGVVVDPSYTIFNDNCSKSNNKNSWNRLVKIGFQHTYLYKKALESGPLNGFSYPSQVKFPIKSNYVYGPFGYVCCRVPSVRPDYWTTEPGTYLLGGAQIYYFNVTIVNNEKGNYIIKSFNASIDMGVGWQYKIKGSDLGGVDGATPNNDATITINAVDSGGRITDLGISGTAAAIIQV
jgi:hypothetical protein